MFVIKRNGTKEQFKKEKIQEAINKAFNALNWKINSDIIVKIVDEIPVWDGITIEEIQE